MEIIICALSDILCPERQFIARLFYADKGDRGKVRIMLRDIRVPLFDQFMEPQMNPLRLRPAGNAKHFGSFGTLWIGLSSGNCWWVHKIKITGFQSTQVP
jgi:hypothetical protein